jgi:hypothetical protein
MNNPKTNLAKVLSALVLLASSFSCRTSPTGPRITGNVQLSAENVACTEVWLKIAFSVQQSAVSKSEFKITRDGDTVLTGSLSGTDTVVIDTTTQAERVYTYKGYRFVDSHVSDTSQPLQVTTLDSTSHNFSWQVFQLGGAASSYLYDVSIVDDSDVYAVGAIYVDSANGQANPYEYNVVRWDGNKWNEYRIYFPGTSGLSPMYSVLAFDSNDVWIGSTEPLHWNGSSWVQYNVTSLTRAYALKFWGTDSSNLYMVGDRDGAIARYDGYTWEKIQSGTTLPIQDIWGRVDPKTGAEEVIAVASNWAIDNGMEVLEVTPTSITNVDTVGLPWSLYGIWSPDAWHYYVCGDGIYKTYSFNTSWTSTAYQSVSYDRSIRGNGVNDFVIAGDFGLLAHWNGSTMREYNGKELPNLSGMYDRVDMKGNMIVAVGALNSGQAIAVIGRR